MKRTNDDPLERFREAERKALAKARAREDLAAALKNEQLDAIARGEEPPTSLPWRGTYTTPQINRVMELHSLGKSCNYVAQATGITPQHVSRIVRERGKTFSGKRMAIALVKQQADRAQERAELVARQEKRVGRILDRLEASDTMGFRTLVRGEYGVEEEHLLEFVPTRDEQALANSLAKHMESLAKAEAANRGLNLTVMGLLENLAEELGLNMDGSSRDDEPE